jgi:hypothetical protein
MGKSSNFALVNQKRTQKQEEDAERKTNVLLQHKVKKATSTTQTNNIHKHYKLIRRKNHEQEYFYNSYIGSDIRTQHQRSEREGKHQGF